MSYINIYINNFNRGFIDLVEAYRNWRVCYLIGSADMRRRYARSKLGPFWIFLSSMISISIMGLVWSLLWNQPVSEMLPFVAVGTIVWQLFSGIIAESTTILPSSIQFFVNQYLPTSIIILALVFRHLIVFIINILFPLFITIYFNGLLSSNILSFIPGLLLLIGVTYFASYFVAIICTRFRDMIQIIITMLQIINYVTPIVWKPELLSEKARNILYLNPIASIISIVRDPILGRPVSTNYWIVAIILLLALIIIILPFIGKFHRRLIYWL